MAVTAAPVAPAASAAGVVRLRTAQLATAVTRSDKRFWLAIFLAFAYVYLLTGDWTRPPITDTQAAYFPAWVFVHHGTFFLENVPHNINTQYFWVGGHLVSNRTPGVILMAVPLEALLAWTHLAPAVAGVLTSTLITAAAVATLALVIARLTSRRLAVAAALVFGLGTATWTVASAELWAHGPDLLWLSLAMLAVSSSRWWFTGVLFGVATLTRPHLALVAAAVGVMLAVSRRTPAIVVKIGSPTAAGLGLLRMWNAHFFGHGSVSGGYSYAEDRVVHGGAQWTKLLENVAGTMVSPGRGLLLYSPVVLVALWLAPRGWKASPDWVRAFFLGGVGYQFVQWRLNDFTGGIDFYSNRLVLELFATSLPLLCCGYATRERSVRWLMFVRGLAALSVGVHAIGALGTPLGPHYYVGKEPPTEAQFMWHTWEMWVCLRADHTIGVLIAAVGVVAVAAAVASASRRPSRWGASGSRLLALLAVRWHRGGRRSGPRVG